MRRRGFLATVAVVAFVALVLIGRGAADDRTSVAGVTDCLAERVHRLVINEGANLDLDARLVPHQAAVRAVVFPSGTWVSLLGFAGREQAEDVERNLEAARARDGRAERVERRGSILMSYDEDAAPADIRAVHACLRA